MVVWPMNIRLFITEVIGAFKVVGHIVKLVFVFDELRLQRQLVRLVHHDEELWLQRQRLRLEHLHCVREQVVQQQLLQRLQLRQVVVVFVVGLLRL